MINSKYFKSANLGHQTVVNTYRFYKSQKEFNRLVTKPINEMCLSNEIQSIKHGESKFMFRKLDNQDTNATKGSSANFKEHGMKRQLSNRRSEIGQPIINKLKLLNLEENKSVSSDDGDEYNVFYYDFMLSNIFGYKWINIRHEEGTFEIFEPTLKKEYLNSPSRINLNRGITKSVSSDFSRSSENSSERRDMPVRLDFAMESQDTKVFSISPVRIDHFKQMTMKQFPEPGENEDDENIPERTNLLKHYSTTNPVLKK